MGRIYVVMGKSSAGKDTIYKRLLENGRLDLDKVVTYTTRPIRMGEENGREYYFVDEERLAEFMQEGKVIEQRFYDTILGRWNYFTVEDGQVDLSNQNYLMISTLEGYAGIIKCYGKEAVVPIYIEVETGLRMERALKREREQKKPNYSEMCRRFLADEEDFKEENLLKLGIENRFQNKDLETCLEDIIVAILS